MLDRITPLILTYNEAPNIERNLQPLAWANDIVVVDSFSSDGTIESLRRFPNVRIFQRVFDTHYQQWEFALHQTGINTSWVLALDADYIATDKFIDELRTLDPESDVSGYFANFVFCVDGKALRSGIYPPVIVLYRRNGAGYEQDGHTQRIQVNGKVKRLSVPLLHDDRKSMTRWLDSQVRYAQLEARKILSVKRTELSLRDRVRRSYVLAPMLMPLYCLFFRGGILDGWPGAQYALERTVAELMLSLHLIRHRVQSASAQVASAPELEVLSTKL